MVAESLPYGWQERSPKQVAAIVLLILMAMGCRWCPGPNG